MSTRRKQVGYKKNADFRYTEETNKRRVILKAMKKRKINWIGIG